MNEASNVQFITSVDSDGHVVDGKFKETVADRFLGEKGR